MTGTEWLLAAILLLCALFSGAIAALQLTQNGKPVNKLYHPEKDNPAPFFRQSGILFLMIAVLFVMLVAAVLLHQKRMLYFVCGWILVTAVYAVVSTAKLPK